MKLATDETKLAALARVSGSLYSEHVQAKGVLSTEAACWCALAAPDQHCDVGVSLFVLRAAEMVRANGGGRD